MLSQTTYLDLVSGKTQGPTGVLGRMVLMILSGPYSAAVRLRNYLYTSGRLTSHRVNAVVISVGNLTVGGTGKTPLVVWLCRLLRDRQLACAILTRGYKTQAGRLSDEPALLAAQCPGVPVIVNPDRVAGAAEAICSHDAQVLVMDDGFQHRRLARDLDIVTIDATRPFGHSSMGVPPVKTWPRWPCYGRVLPAGLLREPVAGLGRADAAVLTRCDQVSENALQQIEQAIRRINRDLVIVRSTHAPAAVLTAHGTEISLEKLAGRRIFAFCGLGNPQAFFRTIESLGGMLVGSRTFDDHYRYTSGDLNHLHGQAAQQQAGLVLTTQKDWTKIPPAALPQGPPPLACLTIELRMTAGAQELTALINHALGGKMPNLYKS